MSDLVVELYGRRIGRLVGEYDTFDFAAAPESIDELGFESSLLSVAVPLSLQPRRSELTTRRNYFEEILAEGPARSQLADKVRLDYSNTIGLLRHYGRDVAGALQIWDPSDEREPRTPAALPASDESAWRRCTTWCRRCTWGTNPASRSG